MIRTTYDISGWSSKYTRLLPSLRKKMGISQPFNKGIVPGDGLQMTCHRVRSSQLRVWAFWHCWLHGVPEADRYFDLRITGGFLEFSLEGFFVWVCMLVCVNYSIYNYITIYIYTYGPFHLWCVQGYIIHIYIYTYTYEFLGVFLIYDISIEIYFRGKP